MTERTLAEVRRVCDEIIGRYGVAFSDYEEERKDGEVKFVYLTLKFKVSKVGPGRNASRSPANANSTKQ